jgi:predicted permease
VIRPPRLAHRLLGARLAPDERDELIGDLDEQFARRAAAGARAARRWYWGQALALTWGFAVRRRDVVSTAHERTRGRLALENAALDWRQAARSLRRSPGFALVALLTIALGIGLSTSVFSVVNGILLQPLPVENAGRLVRLGEVEPQRGALFEGMINAGPAPRVRLRDVSAGVWQSTSETIAAFAPIRTGEVTVTTSAEPLRAVGAEVGPRFFDVFPIAPLLGRPLVPADDDPAASPVVVLTESFWSDRLGGRADVLDLQLGVDGVPMRVVGVIPDTLAFLEADVALLRPARFRYPSPGVTRNFIMSMDITARMKPGVTIDEVRAEGQRVLTTVASADPAFFDGTVPVPQAIVQPLQDDVVGPVRPALTLLFAGMVCVLIASGVNLASLLLARNTARQQDVAVRLALGASRWRIVRPLLFEQLILGGAGGLAGGLTAWWVVRLLPRFAPADLPRLAEVRFDAASLAFIAATALVTAVVVGILPAWQIPSRNVREFTASQADPAGRRGSGSAARSALVVCQVALAAVLLVGALLIGRSLWNLVRVDPGYRPDGVLTFQVATPDLVWRQTGRLDRFVAEVEARLRRHPGVVEVGHATAMPLHYGGNAGTLAIEGRPVDPDNRPRGQRLGVTRGYLPAIGMRLADGRWFGDADSPTSERVCLVNDVFAERFFPGESPIGHRLKVTARDFARIVGVVGSVRIGPLTRDAPPSVIQLATQQPEILGYVGTGAGFAVRASGEPEALISFVREQVRAVEPDWPVHNVERLDHRLGRTFAQPRFYALTLGLFAALAVSTAVLGLYGVLAYAVERRRVEFGIRRALGAGERRIVWLVTRRAAVLAAAGLGVGLGAAAAGARLLGAVLFGLQPLDPASYAGATALVALVVAAASWAPTRRALRIDPARALRVD